MSGTEFDVVIAAYLIPDLAEKDFDALVKLVADKQLTVEGVALVTNHADGHVTVTETGDHLGRKGMEIGGGVGLAVGLLAPPTPRSPARCENRPPRSMAAAPGSSRPHSPKRKRAWAADRSEHGGLYAGGIHFRYQGGQVRSLLSLLSYLGSGEYRKRYLGVPIPPTNLQGYHLQAARKFADGLADRLLPAATEPR